MIKINNKLRFNKGSRDGHFRTQISNLWEDEKRFSSPFCSITAQKRISKRSSWNSNFKFMRKRKACIVYIFVRQKEYTKLDYKKNKNEKMILLSYYLVCTYLNKSIGLETFIMKILYYLENLNYVLRLMNFMILLFYNTTLCILSARSKYRQDTLFVFS